MCVLCHPLLICSMGVICHVYWSQHILFYCITYEKTIDTDKMNYPFEFVIDISDDVEKYYDWLNRNIGKYPRWNIDDRRFIVDNSIKIKFLFKYKRFDNIKLMWFGVK